MRAGPKLPSCAPRPAAELVALGAVGVAGGPQTGRRRPLLRLRAALRRRLEADELREGDAHVAVEVQIGRAHV